MTPEQLLTKFATAKARKVDLSWAQFTAAIGGSDASTKAAVLAAANKGNGSALFKIINRLVVAKKYELARAEVDAAAAADSSLTIDELIAILS